MLGATALIPILVVPAMGGTPKQMAEAREFGPCPAREMTQVSTPHRSSAAREKERPSLVPSRFIQAGGILVRARSIPARPPAARRQVICTIFFVSGCNTLLQTTIGDRLPIVQGGSFAFLSPTFAVIGQVGAMVASGEIGVEEQFEQTMRRIQGAILTCGFIQVALGYSGVLGLLTRFISPLTIAPTVCMVGLGLYTAPNINGNFQPDGSPLPVPGCEGYAAAVIICMVVFSQLLGFVNLKIGGASIKIFALFPVLWTVMVAWGIGGIAQAAGGMDDDYLGGRYEDVEPGHLRLALVQVAVPGSVGRAHLRQVRHPAHDRRHARLDGRVDRRLLRRRAARGRPAAVGSRHLARPRRRRARVLAVPSVAGLLKLVRRAAAVARVGGVSFSAASSAPATAPPRTARTSARSASPRLAHAPLCKRARAR